MALHARARGVPAALAGTVAVAVLVVVLGDWLREHGGFADRTPAVTVASLAALLAAVLPGAGLAGADDELERSTPLPWPWWRTGHLLAVAAATAAAFAAAGAASGALDGPGVLLRDVAGLLGLTALSAVVVGARAAWAPVTAYVLVTFLLGLGGGPGVVVWGWAFEPAGSRPAAITAAALAATGGVLYALRGARPGEQPAP